LDNGKFTNKISKIFRVFRIKYYSSESKNYIKYKLMIEMQKLTN